MTHHPLLNRPLLIHTLAAVLLCPVAFAQTKTLPMFRKDNAGKTAPGKKQSPEKAPAAAKKNSKAAPAPKAVPLPPARQLAARQPKGLQTEGDAAVQKPVPLANAHLALIVDPAELLARVPASGPLGEEELVRLAIANSPALERRRAAIALARADKRAVQDWENPELRLSYGSQDDDYIRDPYTERTIENYTGNETSSGTDTTTSLAGLGELGYGEVTTDTNASTGSTTRYREIERIVTPRKGGGEDVVTNVYELRTENSTGTRDREFTDGLITQNRRDQLAENVTRTLQSTSRESTTSTEGGNGTESFSALIRFQVPHLWERKARIQRASAEIMLAESQYLADEDRLVREVRDLYETLSVLESTASAQRKRRQSYTTFRTEMESANVPEFAMDAARARVEMTKALIDIRENESDIDRTREQLAAFCGLRNASRIRCSGLSTRRVVDLATLDADYLVEIAMLYRADMVESRSRVEIAKGHLAEAQAAKIPWASFIDAGWTRQWADGRSGEEDEWMIRFGMNIPLWEWTGINKRSAEYKKAAAAWELQMEKQKQRISAEVELAIERLRKTARTLRGYEGDLRDLQKEAKETVAKLEASAAGLTDYSKGKRTKYEYEDLTQQMEIGRFEAYSDYNKALMALEDAIGVRIEKALNGWRDK